MKTIDLLSEDGYVGLKTVLMLLLGSNPSLYQFDEYLDCLRGVVKFNYRIGESDLWNTLGLTKEEALEYFNAVLNDDVSEWATKHGCDS